MPGTTPAAEVDISVELVRSLLTEQHDDLADLDLRPAGHGWDNAMFRLGETLAVRLPRRAAAAPLILHEQRWLPEIAPRLPVLVPTPLRTGRPTSLFPWSWSILPWFDGEPIGADSKLDRSRLALDLGRFVAHLHRAAPVDAPSNPYRGVPLKTRAQATADRLDLLADMVDVEAGRRAWSEAVDAPTWDDPPTWLHGDLHPLNLVQHDGRLVAVVDFGDLCGGDPACDLLCAWALFEPADRDRFRRAADTAERPIDDAMWTRARGWAVAHSVAILSSSADSPQLEAVGLRTYAAAIAT